MMPALGWGRRPNWRRSRPARTVWIRFQPHSAATSSSSGTPSARGPFLRQEAPRTAGAQLVEDGVEDRAQRVQVWAPRVCLRRQEWVDEGPLGIGQIARKELGRHASAYSMSLPARFQFSDGL